MVGTVLGAFTYVIMFLFYDNPVGFVFLPSFYRQGSEARSG